MPRRMSKNIIAVVYDFDGTLSPQPMQEYTVFPRLRVEPKDFWREVKKENRKIKGEEIITYMMLMLKMANAPGVNLKISKSDLGKMAQKIRFFHGVKTFFKRIDEFVEKESGKRMKCRHYIISSGLKEILNKLSIRGCFKNVFASEYYYDSYGAPQYPKLVVTDTVKTQFLFRINKGREKISESINEFMEERKRPIPFDQIIYIGDGMTDVPCMTVTRKNRGHAIAVYNPSSRRGKRMCKRLFVNARADFIAEADYRKNKNLDRCLKAILKKIIHNKMYEETSRQTLSRQGVRSKSF